tara:strand:- start:242 stop:403 length:162 start_codon:yes stop_codon:yes gene_type:complete
MERTTLFLPPKGGKKDDKEKAPQGEGLGGFSYLINTGKFLVYNIFRGIDLNPT